MGESAFVWLYLMGCILIVFAAVARRHSGGQAFGFFVLAVIASPILAYAFLMALPLASAEPRSRLDGSP